jgi:hypothetical protein
VECTVHDAAGMLGVLILASGALFGIGVVRRIGLPLSRVEAFAVATTVASAVVPWLLFVAAWACGFAAGLPLAVALLAAAGYGLARGRRVEPAATARGSRLSWAVIAVLFALLFHGHMLHERGGALFTGGSTFGDLALHATLATRFAVADLELVSPIAAGHALAYPFLGDFVVACLVRGGLPLGFSFAITGWLAAMAGLALIHAIAARLFARRAAATIAVWLVVASGALVGTYYFGQDVLATGLPRDPGAMPSYANMWDRGVMWSNFVCDFLLPQRAFLAAFPVVMLVGWLLLVARTRRAILAAGGLVGLLPLLHVHGFVIAMGLFAWLTAWRAVAERRIDRVAILALAIGALLATPQLVWQLAATGDSFGRWNLGWRAPEGGFWWFWLRNWGLGLVTLPLAAWFARELDRSGRALALLAGSVAVFAVANVYQFQPHDWDNMKLMVYAHIGTAIVLAGALAELLTRHRVCRVLAATVIVGMTSTGVLCLVRELDKSDQLASARDVEIAKHVARVVPPDALVVTSDQHSHLVSMLAGRRIVMGYRGWLWTHGIDYTRLERDVRAVLAAEPRADSIIKRQGITHVFVGPGERHQWGAKPDRLATRYRRVLALHDIEVFDVRGAQPAMHAAVGAPR